MISLLIFLLVLSALVLGHECGHYIAARICGVKAEEFGYGFPPRAIGFVRSKGRWKRVDAKDQRSYPGTIWSINWLPLGGFVRLKGEEGGTGGEKDSFLSKSVFARIFILVAGVAMNWFMAASIFIFGFLIGVPAQLDGLPSDAIITDRQVQIVEVLAGSAAEKGKLETGDFILQVDTVPVQDDVTAQQKIAEDAIKGKTIDLQILRKKELRHVSIQAEYIESLERPGLGVKLASTGIVRFSLPSAIGQGVTVTWGYTKLIVSSLGQLVGDLFVRQKVSEGLSGPVGIAVLTSRIAEQGVWSVMQFAALLSINLAVINILPIPALDGGRIFFILLESVRRRRSNALFEATVHRIGFVLLLGLIFLVTIHDVRQYGGVIWQGLKQAVGM